MIKLIKKTFLLLIAISIFITSMPKIDAKAEIKYPDVDYQESSSGGGGGTGNSCNSGRKYCGSYDNNGIKRTYEATLDRIYTYPEITSISVYDMHDNDIINADMSISESNLPLAGTAIGLNIHEKKKISVAIKYITIKVKKQSEIVIVKEPQYVCKYTSMDAKPLPFEKEQEYILYEKIENSKCLYTEIVKTENTVCPVIAGCKSTKITDEKGYPETEYIEKEEIVGIPDRTIRVDLTNVRQIDKINYEFTPLTTQFTKGIDYDEIDFQYVIEAIEYLSNYFFNNTTLHIDKYEPSYDITISNSNDINSAYGIALDRSAAQASAKWYDRNGQPMNCSIWREWGNRFNAPLPHECRWVYIPGELVGDTYYIGGVNTRGTMYDVREIDMYYKFDRACMEPKTGKVSYKTGTTKCKADEFEINNTTIGGDEHWHYFVPLNAKSQDGITVQMKPRWKYTLSKESCITQLREYYIIREDSTETPSTEMPYYKTIKPASGETFFKGDYFCVDKCGTDDAVFNDNSSDYLSIINNNGCYKSSEITIPIKQLFYNETENSKFNGFNFYYKPIDINNSNQVDVIFPNGIDKNIFGAITTPTLWDDWYKAQTEPTASKDKEPDLSKSFDTATYIAQNVSANEVRNYTKNNPYTSWSKMNLDGTSSYISSNGAIKRIGDATKNIYKLGCGPLNESEYVLDKNGLPKTDWLGNKIKNILYVKECGTK